MASLPLAEAPVGSTRRLATSGVVHARWLILAWLLCSLILLWLSRNELGQLGFRDPDDAMRLQQVRDWIQGQSFWDVSQHRVNPPIGGPMHWSRIVDMPIAAMILLLQPLTGGALAEVVACSVVPLLLLGSLAWALYTAASRIAGKPAGMLAPILLFTTPTILVQFGPLRIDHHGWQILMATIALAGAMDPHARRGGVTAGAAMAVWLQISSEGLPYAALFAAIFALRQWQDRDEVGRLVGYALTLGGAALLLLAILRGMPPLREVQCDALSAAYVWPLLAFAIVTALAFRIAAPVSASGRLLAAGSGALAAAAVFIVTGRPCITGDPFQSLGPVAYKLWYLQVMEGRPIWEQAHSMMGVILLPPIVGLTGSLFAARFSGYPKDRGRWLTLALLLIGATLIAMLVMRAMSVAHVLALPALGWIMLRLFHRAQQQRATLARVLTSSSIALLTPAALCAIWIVLTSNAADQEVNAPIVKDDCRAAATLAPLRQLDRSTLFAPLDMGPDILIRTDHNVIGTAHHRNAAGITAVVEAFTAPPAKAQEILGALNSGRGPDYLVTCASLNEFGHYAKDHPGSLAAMLNKGSHPTWLQPVRLHGAPSLHVYKITPPKS